MVPLLEWVQLESHLKDCTDSGEGITKISLNKDLLDEGIFVDNGMYLVVICTVHTLQACLCNISIFCLEKGGMVHKNQYKCNINTVWNS